MQPFFGRLSRSFVDSILKDGSGLDLDLADMPFSFLVGLQGVQVTGEASGTAMETRNGRYIHRQAIEGSA